MRSNRSNQSIAEEIQTQLSVLGGLVALAWLLELADLVIWRGSLNSYGIRPRTWVGLRGILFAPFLHGSLAHLLGNTIPFVILGWLVMLRETKDFFTVSILSGLASGLGTWLVGAPNTIHIGASGVVFGYLGYLLLRSYFERSAIAIAFSVFVAMLYGSLLFGLVPQYGISWEGHLFGFLGGVLSAWLLAEPNSR